MNEKTPDLSFRELKENPKVAAEIAWEILKKLESAGECRFVYHRLMAVAFDDKTMFCGDDE